ncbi:hypothetical protein D9M71_705420 [compost metagenome]
MHPPNTHGDAWYQHGEAVQGRCNAAATEQPLKKADTHGYQQVDEEKHPVFFPARAPGNHEILLQHFEIPVAIGRRRRRRLGSDYALWCSTLWACQRSVMDLFGATPAKNHIHLLSLTVR